MKRAKINYSRRVIINCYRGEILNSKLFHKVRDTCCSHDQSHDFKYSANIIRFKYIVESSLTNLILMFFNINIIIIVGHYLDKQLTIFYLIRIVDEIDYLMDCLGRIIALSRKML